MAKAKSYTVAAEQITAGKVWDKGDTVSEDELDPTVVKRLLANDPPLLVEIVDTAAPAASGG